MTGMNESMNGALSFERRAPKGVRKSIPEWLSLGNTVFWVILKIV